MALTDRDLERIRGVVREEIHEEAVSLRKWTNERLDELEGRVNLRLDGVETRLDGVETRLDGVETRLDGVETRLDGVETRLDGVETRLDGVEARLDGVEARLDGVETRLDGVEKEVREGFARVTNALSFLANCWPGTMPGRKSHVARKVEEILTA